jgi:hypothetical protein
MEIEQTSKADLVTSAAQLHRSTFLLHYCNTLGVNFHG